VCSEYKLVVVIADDDADRLISKLVERSFPVTKVSSTGGFLRRGRSSRSSDVSAQHGPRLCWRRPSPTRSPCSRWCHNRWRSGQVGLLSSCYLSSGSRRHRAPKAR